MSESAPSHRFRVLFLLGAEAIGAVMSASAGRGLETEFAEDAADLIALMHGVSAGMVDPYDAIAFDWTAIGKLEVELSKWANTSQNASAVLVTIVSDQANRERAGRALPESAGIIMSPQIGPAQVMALIQTLTRRLEERKSQLVDEMADDDADAEMEALRAEYLAGLGIKLVEIAEAYQAASTAPSPESLAELRTLLHRMRGTAGMCGIESLGQLAGRCEEAVKGIDPHHLGAEALSGIEPLLADLETAVERVLASAGLPSLSESM